MQLFENLTGQEMEDYTISLDEFERADETDKAEHMAEQMCIAFMYHDRREWGMGVQALYQTERLQFPFLSTHEAYEVARLYMKALWEKDVVEAEHMDGLDVDVEGLRDADWSPVEEPLVRRAELVGADPLYGVKTAAGWCEHKVGGDYWTPMMQAQHAEIGPPSVIRSIPRNPSTDRQASVTSPPSTSPVSTVTTSTPKPTGGAPST